MKTQQTKSGLVIPAPPEPNPHVTRGPLEFRDPDRREAVAGALNALWDAMDLSASHGIGVDGETWEAHYKTWRYFGEMLLGKDCPDREVMT